MQKHLYNIYSQATSRIHLDKLVSDEFPIHREVRQRDPLSRKLFTAVMDEVFREVDISQGIDVDGENLTNFRFADDVALFKEKQKQSKWKKHLTHFSPDTFASVASLCPSNFQLLLT